MTLQPPIWQAIRLHCRNCDRVWHDWQPCHVPMATWAAHLKTYQCPECGAGCGAIVLDRVDPIGEC